MDQFIGSIQLFAFGFPPIGWMLCDGTALSISQNTALFALVGTTYGGDGQQTFALPNLKGKEPVPGSGYCICVNGIFPSRQ